jgi:glycosyltransferase involved in cell wall biosynthesis
MRSSATEPPLVVWGTYDLDKPRVRILLRAARERGYALYEIGANIWQGVEDKSQIDGWRRVGYLLRWLCAYPVLIWRYLLAPRHQLVFVPYMGHADVILLWPFARLRGAKVVWDALVSLHGTLVEDRSLVAEGSLAAKLIKLCDWLAFRCADQIITGTGARAEQFAREYGLDRDRITALFVAAELEHFQMRSDVTNACCANRERPQVLLYGQFAPLHGLPVVLEAAASEVGRQWDWVLVGTGQEGWRIRQWLEREAPTHVRWLESVPYAELPSWIQRADVCLGTFGTSQKALSGISNKIFQILACGRPLITGDTPAVRELLDSSMDGVYLVPPGDGGALAR